MLSSTNNHLMLNNRTYSVVKWFVQIVLPAFAAAYFSLAGIWDLPNPEEIVGTIAIVTTFLGVVLGISSHQYETSGAAYDGKMVITNPEEDRQLFSLELDKTPEEINHMKSLRFKVDPRLEQYTSTIDDTL